MTHPALPFTDLSGFLNDQSRRIDRLERTPRVRPNNRSSFGTESPTSIFDAARILSGDRASSGVIAGLWTLSEPGEILIDTVYDLGTDVTATAAGASSGLSSYVTIDEYGLHIEASALYSIRVSTRWDFDTQGDSWNGRAWEQLTGISSQTVSLGAITGGPEDFADDYCTGLLSHVFVGSPDDTPSVEFACYGNATLLTFSGYLSIEVLDSSVS